MGVNITDSLPDSSHHLIIVTDEGRLSEAEGVQSLVCPALGAMMLDNWITPPEL